ncbi:MAG TPA: DPP IV N-terminal domain-containing protein [Candidatus Cybelea sp.]|jgi:dipeptidyl-peptidase-4|nr:DPP IV N-terminal domain-containing protein [Candidatus Cybelea sp.]
MLAAAAAAITLDSVFTKEPPWGRMISRISWSPDGQRFLYVRPSQDPDESLAVMLYDVASGSTRVWLRAGALPRTPEVAGWAPGGARVALLAGGDLYAASLRDPHPQRVAQDVDDAQWSPRGNSLAYSHGADLYVASPGAGTPVRRVTRGGNPGDLLNGTLDWVYPEELGIEHGFRWSPDGKRIAYLTMDERRVTNFPIVDFLTVNNAIDNQRYPLAGQANPRVALHVVEAAGRAGCTVYDAAKRDEYLAAFDWVPHSGFLEAEILDRAQRTMRVELWRAPCGNPALLYHQASSTWVDVAPLPFWLRNGDSIWLLDRENTAGVYLRRRDGSLRRLSGSGRVTDLYGVEGETIYARAAYPTRRDRSLLAISLGGAQRNLTPAPGWHELVPAPHLAHFVDTYSRLNDPPRVDLVGAPTGALTQLVPESLALRADLLPAKMFEVPSAYGSLDGFEIDPADFDSAKRWPVVMYVYGGPDAPTTSDRFGGLYDQLLAREGVVVISIDGPASQVDNDDHVRLLYHNFGPGSLLGQEIGARYVASLPYVDPSRIGIWGWSFGGYETVYALTHSRLFAAGAAVAPVTDWHFYDSIYTERYMGLPARESIAYKRSSTLDSAGHLAGPLLVQHGTSDDNVHLANTIALLQKFVLAHETRVQFYPYPRKTHGIRGLPQQRSVYARMLEFWRAVFSLSHAGSHSS